MERVQFDGSRTFSAGQFRLVRVREGGINGVPEVESPAPQVPCLFCWHENEPSTVALLGKGVLLPGLGPSGNSPAVLERPLVRSSRAN